MHKCTQESAKAEEISLSCGVTYIAKIRIAYIVFFNCGEMGSSIYVKYVKMRNVIPVWHVMVIEINCVYNEPVECLAGKLENYIALVQYSELMGEKVMCMHACNLAQKYSI